MIFQFWKKYSFVLLLAFLGLGMFDSRIAVVASLCMIAPVLISVFRGRFWCGNFCPRGNFYDRIVSRFSNRKNVPHFLKSKGFRAAVLVMMMSMFSAGTVKNWGNLSGIGLVFYRMILVTTVVGVAMSFLYNSRTWCHFCPMGTLAAIVSSLRTDKKVLQISTDCVSCKLCEKKCSLGIIPYEYQGNSLSHPDCIQCGACVQVCPKDAIGYEMDACEEESEEDYLEEKAS